MKVRYNDCPKPRTRWDGALLFDTAKEPWVWDNHCAEDITKALWLLAACIIRYAEISEGILSLMPYERVQDPYTRERLNDLGFHEIRRGKRWIYENKGELCG